MARHLGLTHNQVLNNRKKFGENRIVSGKSFSPLLLLLTQFTSPMMVVLLTAGAVSYALHGVNDAIVVWGAVLINGLFGFYQEYKAESALSALEKIVEVSAEVVRGSKRVTIPIEEVVVGDVVYLKSGDKVPADGIMLEATTLSINESMLTGESSAVIKEGGNIADPEKLAENRLAYMGTAVISGLGVLLVTRVGDKTKMGQIAKSLTRTKRIPTELQRQIARFAKVLTLIVIGIASLLFFVGLLKGMPLREIFLVAVAVAVSAIPEGLAVSLTVILAVGMQKLLKRKGLIRKLLVAEALGKVTVFCADKTGTLTTGELTVVKTVGKEIALAQASVLGNDMADMIEIAAGEWGAKKFKSSSWRRVATIPFDSQRKYGACLSTNEAETRLYLRGAPEIVLAHSVLSKSERMEWENTFRDLAREGYRLVGIAESKLEGVYKELDPILDNTIAAKKLKFLGILVMEDPIRKNVADDIVRLALLGIRFCVITGDFAETAGYVMNKLGIDTEGKIITGQEFKKLSDKEQVEIVKNGVLFARFAPEDKLRVVELLKEEGEIVAMMGDGINDAPALKSADVGIVVSTASEVSKETADMVLLDNKFATVIAGIEEGRSIFERVKRVIRYLLSDSLDEVVVVTISILAGLPLPVTAAQILWINLANDTFPAMAIAFDPVEANKNPVKINGQGALFDLSSKMLVGVVSLVSGLLVILMFFWYLKQGVDISYARSVAFAFLGINTLFSVFVIRNFSIPLWRTKLFDNWYVWAGVGVGVFMQLVALYQPTVQKLLGTVPILFSDWVVIAGATIGVVASIEIVKYVLSRWVVKLPITS